MSGGSDCAWLDEVTWTPTSGLAAWLAERNLTADARAANGRTAAECYALGLDPALATNDFRIVSIEMVDGEPKVEWEPKVNRWTGVEIQAVLKGAEKLEGPWEDVSEGGSPGGLAPPLTARPTFRLAPPFGLPHLSARPEGSPHHPAAKMAAFPVREFLLALEARIWDNRRVGPFRRAVSFPRVPSSRVTCLANGAKGGSATAYKEN